jgi:hypothetical protein
MYVCVYGRLAGEYVRKVCSISGVVVGVGGGGNVNSECLKGRENL